MKRKNYIDALRGLAIVFMAVNHAGHYLTASYLPAWAYLLIYLTVTLAAPLFLFLSGFSVVLSLKNHAEAGDNFRLKVLWQYLWRGFVLIGLGLLVNLLFYYNEPLWRGRILQTIGLSLMIIYPFYLLARHRFSRLILLAVSLSAFLVYPFIYPWLQAFSLGHRLMTEIFMSEFPLYPWFFLMLTGLIAGQEFSAWGDLARKIRIRILCAGGLLIFLWLAMSLAIHGANIFSFSNDYDLNGYWNPSPLTWLWILGWILILLLVFYAWENNALRSMLRNNWLAQMGRSAIFLYFLQFFLIITIGQAVLHFQIDNFWELIIVTSLIIFILCLSATSSLFATDSIFGRLKPKARIS